MTKEERNTAIRRLNERGLSLQAVADRLNISHSTVWNVLNDYPHLHKHKYKRNTNKTTADLFTKQTKAELAPQPKAKRRRRRRKPLTKTTSFNILWGLFSFSRTTPVND